MRIIDVVQGSDAWLDARAFLPTSSHADEIMTPGKLAPSASQTGYRNKLLAEYIFGHWIDWNNKTHAMELGTEREDNARAWYELTRGVDVEQVGLILTDDGRFGCSPDGLVGEDGMVEIKNPLLHTHVGYLVDPATLVKEYRGQTQAQLWVTGRAWCDLISYNPDIERVVVRVEPDPAYQEAWEKVLGAFLDDFDDAKRRVAEFRVKPDRSPLPDEGSYLLRQLERSLAPIGPVEAMAADALRLS